jgi:hypothetical protein
VLFLIELGAVMMVASTTEPLCGVERLALSMSLMVWKSRLMCDLGSRL